MPATKPDISNDDPAKVDRFKELARELGCDEDEEAFGRAEEAGNGGAGSEA
jgi:hypothetical protein